MHPPAILDASALVALLRRERGHEVILQAVQRGAATTPTGLAEALTVCVRRGHRRTAPELAEDLAELGLTVVPLLEEDAVEIAFVLHRSDAARTDNPKLGTLSLGDAACLAVAHRLGVPAVMSDVTWEVLDLGGTRVVPFR